MCLALDCLIAHEFDSQSAAYINLQQYVIREKKLREREALVIFYNIVSAVERLHKVKIFDTEIIKELRTPVRIVLFLNFRKILYIVTWNWVILFYTSILTKLPLLIFAWASSWSTKMTFWRINVDHLRTFLLMCYVENLIQVPIIHFCY